MNKAYHWKRAARQTGAWLALGGLGIGIAAVYRWAEPRHVRSLNWTPPRPATVTLKLENTRFSGAVQGRRTWSLWARLLEVEQALGGSDIHSAVLTDIRDGVLYTAPDTLLPNSHTPVLPVKPRVETTPPDKTRTSTTLRPSDDPKAGPALARFRARQGRYTTATADPLPPDLALLYQVQSQIRLTGDVDFKTRTGEHLNAPQMTLLEMFNRRTARPERRIACDQGVSVAYKNVKVFANQARYDPDVRLVECLGGVKGNYRDGAIQSERAFWSLKEQTLRCPETASGTFPATKTSPPVPFTAQDVTVNMKTRQMKAGQITMTLAADSGAFTSVLNSESPAHTSGKQGEFAMQNAKTGFLRRSRRRLLLAGVGLLGANQCSPPAQGQSAPPAAASLKTASQKQVTPPAPAKKTVALKISELAYSADGTVGTGHDVHYTDGSVVVTSKQGKVIRETEHLDLVGDLIMDDRKYHLIGNEAHVDYGKGKGIALVDNSVVIDIKPTQTASTTPSPNSKSSDIGSERGRGGTVTCDHVESRYRKKFVIMRGHVVFTQRIPRPNKETLERMLTCEHAEYDAKKDTLVLFAPVDFHDSDGTKFHNEHNVIVGTKEGQETVKTQGQSSLNFDVDDTEESDDENTPAAIPPNGSGVSANQPQTPPASPPSAPPKSSPPPK